MRYLVPLGAIAGIVAMQLYAMAHGHDGLVLGSCVAAIAGIGGWHIRGRKNV